MRIKKIGAILAGAVMIGSAVAAAWDPSENEDFFIDPDTGQPNAVIVVGANAAASDVTAGGWIAAQIGNMAYKTIETEIVGEYTWKDIGLTGEELHAWPPLTKYIISAEKPIGENLGHMSSLYWVDLDESKSHTEYDVHEWMRIRPGGFYEEAITYDWSPIVYAAHFQLNKEFVFLGQTLFPIAVTEDSITCAVVNEHPIHAIEVGVYPYDGYIVNFKDIDLYGAKISITVTDLDGKKHSDILSVGENCTIEDSDGNLVFQLVLKDVFLGTSTEEAYIEVTTWSNYKEIELPIYCLTDGLNYWNVEFGRSTVAGYNLNLWFAGFYGYSGSYPPIERTYSIPVFDITEVKDFDYVSGTYISVNFNSEISYEEGNIIWTLDDVVTKQKTGKYEKIKIPVKIDPTQLVVNDDEVTIAHKLNYNLILVGGPGLVLQPNGESLPANTLTREIVENNLSEVDWYTTTGVYEYIEDVYSDKDVIIVAGADRAATKNAVISLLNDLRD